MLGLFRASYRTSSDKERIGIGALLGGTLTEFPFNDLCHYPSRLSCLQKSLLLNRRPVPMRTLDLDKANPILFFIPNHEIGTSALHIRRMVHLLQCR